jgi:cell division protein FtsB
MEKKYTLILDNEFIRYCEINNIKEIEDLAKQTFEKGFTSLKYGDTPSFIKPKKIVNNTEEIEELKNKNKLLENQIEELKKSKEIINKKTSSSLYDE